MNETYKDVAIHSVLPGSIIVDIYVYYKLTTNASAMDLYTAVTDGGGDFLDYGIEFSSDNLTVQGMYIFTDKKSLIGLELIVDIIL